MGDYLAGRRDRLWLRYEEVRDWSVVQRLLAAGAELHDGEEWIGLWV